MEMAESAKKLSTCSRRQVGVIITDWSMSRVVSIGYNGNYSGGPNACDRPDDIGNCGCLHAEDNALVKAPYGEGKLILFTTLSPCITCAKRIINSSVRKVVYHDAYRNHEGLDLLKRMGIELYKLS